MDNKLGVTGGIGMYNGKRVLFQKHGKTYLPSDRFAEESLELSGQDTILVERSINEKNRERLGKISHHQKTSTNSTYTDGSVGNTK